MSPNCEAYPPKKYETNIIIILNMHRSQGNMSGRDLMPMNIGARERLELEVGITPLQLLNSRHKIHPLFKERYSHI
jgi:hypothetical protein